MKKSISIIMLSLVLIFSFTACGNEDKKIDEKDSKQVENQANTNDSIETENEDDKKEEDNKDSTESQNETAEGSVEQVDSTKAKELIQEGAILIDVRTQEEFDEKHIDGAILMPYDEISTLISEQIEDKDTKVILYCRSGRRSGIAAQSLLELGYKHIYDLGAMSSWQ